MESHKFILGEGHTLREGVYEQANDKNVCS